MKPSVCRIAVGDIVVVTVSSVVARKKAGEGFEIG